MTDKQPEGTTDWFNVWHIGEVLERLEDVIGKREASGMDDSASKGANSLQEYVKGMLNALEEIISELQDIGQFVASEIPTPPDHYVPEEWEEEPEE